MALTKVTGGILSQPIDLGITTATTGFFSGIVTAQSVRVLGDLTVDGSTTTLDTVVTEVDRLEVGANNVTVGVAITQSGTGDILRLYDSSTPVFTVKDGGKVGIGTDNPLQKLHIADNTSANIYLETKNSTTGVTAGLYYKTSSSTASDFFKTGIVLEDDGTSHARGKLHILQNNTADGSNATLSDSVVTFTQDGYVGIGTNDPQGQLHISGGNDGDCVLIIEADEDNAGSENDNPYIKFVQDGGIEESAIGMNPHGVSVENNALVLSNSVSALGGIIFKTGTVNGYTNATERLRIASDGNIGIGINDPDRLLHLESNGNSYIRLTDSDITAETDSAVGVIEFETKDTNSAGVSALIGAYHEDTSGNSYLKFNTGNASTISEKVRITSDGNVGIGTDNPDQTLHVFHSTANNIALFESGDSFAAMGLSDSNGSVSFLTTLGALRIGVGGDAGTPGTNSTLAMTIKSDGKVGIGTDNSGTLLNVYGTDSRIRLSKSDAAANVKHWDLAAQGERLRLQAKNDAGGGGGNLFDFYRVAEQINEFRGVGAGVTWFVVDNDNKRVGIGTDSPAEKLDVAGHIKVDSGPVLENASSGSVLKITSATGYLEVGSKNTSYSHFYTDRGKYYFNKKIIVDEGLFGSYNEDLVLATNIEDERIRIKNDTGNVGIGITNPGALLDIGGNTDGNIQAIMTRGMDSAFQLQFRNETSSNNPNTTTGMFGLFRNDVDIVGMQFLRGSGVGAGSLAFTTGGSEKLRIKADGSVGIGTNNPGELLVAYKTSNDAVIKARTTAAGAYLEADSASTGYYGIRLSSVGTQKWFLGSYATNNFTIKDGSGAAGTETFTIVDGTGNIGIGTADPGTARLFAYKDGTNQKLQEWGGNLGSTSGKRTMQLYSPETDTTNNYFTFATGNAFKFKVDSIDALCVASDGEIGIGINNPQYKLHVGGNIRTTGDLYVDNNLGVGTTNPDVPLHILSSSNNLLQIESTDRHSTMYLIDSIGSSFIQNDSGELRFGVGGGASAAGGETEAVRIDSSGFVGIGTFNPDHNLHVFSGSGDAVITIESTGNGNHSALEFMRTSSGGASKGAGSIYVTGDTSESAAKMKFGVAHNINHGTFPKMTIDGGTGKVGIGTENPVRVLHVEHSDCRIRLTEVGEPIDVELHNNGGNAVLTTNGASQLRLQTNNTERLVITDDGRIGINTNSPGTGVELDVHGFLQVRDETNKLSMQVDGANGQFKVFQSPPGWSNLTYNPNPILAWDFKSGPGDLFYIGSGGNTATADQMALVISDEHGFKVGRSGYDGTDFDVSPTAEYFRITKTGNVGIGTNIPSSRLHVFAATGDCVLTLEADRGNSTSTENDNPYIVFKQDGSVSNSAIGMNPNGINSETNSLVLVNGAGSGGIIFKTGTGGNMTSGTNQRLKIEPAGNVIMYHNAKISGICTANTGFMFGTDGQHYLYESASDTISLRITSDGPYAQFRDVSGDVLMGSASGDLLLSASNAEKVRIKGSSGAALFGGLTTQNGQDTSKIAVQGGDSNIGAIQVHAGGGETSGDLSGITFSHGVDNSTARAKGAIALECDGTGYGRGDLCFYVDGTGDNNQVSSADERVRIMNNGAIAIGTDNAIRGPVHIHQNSNDDVQVHLSNNETGATSSGRGFTIFGGAGTSGRDMGFVNRETTGAIEFYTNIGGTLAQRGGWHTGSDITTFCINTASNGTHSNFYVSNHDTTDYNGTANRSEYPMLSDIHFTGSDAISGGNKTKAAWRHDVENTITNNTSNTSGERLQVYGIYSTLNSTRYSYIQYGAYLFANSSPDNAPRTQTVIGCYGYAQGYAASSSPDKSMNIYGGHFIGYRGGNTSGGHAFGLLGKAQQITNGSNKTGDLTGVYGEAEVDDGPVTNAYAFRGFIDVDDETASGNEKAEITNAYLFYGSYGIESTVGAAVTNKRGIYLYHCTNSYIQGDLEITGNITAPNNKSFRIPHPLVGLTTTKDLVHTAIEGPQVDLIYRGKTTLVAGISTINIDTKAGMTEGTFVALNRDVQCFTTNETGWTNVKGSVTGNQLTIIAQENTCTDTISWMVIGERQDDSIKGSTSTDADGKLILEPDKKPVEESIANEHEEDKDINDPDGDINPAYE